jgi:hypothetical protein
MQYPCIQNGRVTEQGTYEVLKGAHGDFAAFVEEFMSQDQHDQVHEDSHVVVDAVCHAV